MKILHVSTPLSWRGGEQQLLYLAQSLREEGQEQVILCSRDSEIARRAESIGLTIQTLPKPGGIDLRYAARLAAITKKYGADLIHVHDAKAHTMAVLAAAFWRNTSPIVLSRRVDYPVKASVFSSWKYKHPSIARYVCVSEAVAQVLLPSIRDPQKIRVVYDGISLDKKLPDVGEVYSLRSGLSIPSDHVVIGNIAALTQQKDYFTFLAAAQKILQHRAATFVIFGEGEQRPLIEKEIERLGLQGRVWLMGFRKDAKHLLPQLDLLLFSSEKEGLGSGLLDAMAAGVPIVATEVGGIPEIITHGVNGLLAPVKDAAALAENAISLLHNVQKREKMVEAARSRVKEFDYRRMGAQTLKIYREILHFTA